MDEVMLPSYERDWIGSAAVVWFGKGVAAAGFFSDLGEISFRGVRAQPQFRCVIAAQEEAIIPGVRGREKAVHRSSILFMRIIRENIPAVRAKDSANQVGRSR